MSHTESIVPQSREAALEGFLCQGYAGPVGDPPSSRLRRTELGDRVGHKPHLAPGGDAGSTLTRLRPRGEGKHEAIRRLSPPISESPTLATLRDPAPAGLPRLLSGELSVARATASNEASI
jgi:hypothetical protein